MYIPFILSLSLSLSLTYFRAVCSRVRRVLQSPARLQRGFLALVGLWPSLTPLCGLAFSRYAVGSCVCVSHQIHIPLAFLGVGPLWGPVRASLSSDWCEQSNRSSALLS